MTWADIDWAALERLRGLFLSGAAAHGAYWTSADDLASYDFTYGERIGWKWDAVLRELDLRGWKPLVPAPARPERPRGTDEDGVAVLDWGCGSGVAGRRVVRWLGADGVDVFRVWDRSALAAGFAADAAHAAFSRLAVEQVTPGFLASDEPIGVLVISHVLTELPAEDLRALRGLAARTSAILWVEPGTPEASRALVEIREQLRGRFRLVAPCTHQAGCGLLAPANSRHWCHHFAAPPAEIFSDSNWVKFGQRAGIDLRSLPYSFLALERGSAHPDSAGAAGLSRVIGEPRVYKGFAKVLSCDADGVRELTQQKRDAPGLFRELKRPAGALLYRWTRKGDRVTGGERLAAPTGQRAPPN
ncbi:MAG TPA: small ribosomal subunit Rsm22 family protein [Opitutaceae bacterium]|nr:small ribosomal subunit Rsm22 family protein [Opitutaceae bacterium]